MWTMSKDLASAAKNSQFACMLYLLAEKTLSGVHYNTLAFLYIAE